MFITQISGLAFGDKQLDPTTTNIAYATIAPGSVLDVVEVDGQPLGLTGVVPVRRDSKVAALARSCIADPGNDYESIRAPEGFSVVQVHDSVSLCLWAPGEVPVPVMRRAPVVVAAAAAATGVGPHLPMVPVDPFGPGDGLRLMRVGCPGRQTATIWVAKPDLNPGATVDVLWRLRRPMVADDAREGPAGTTNGNWEQIVSVPASPAGSGVISGGDTGYAEPIVVQLRGAVEFELYAANNTAGDGFWAFSVELADAP